MGWFEAVPEADMGRAEAAHVMRRLLRMLRPERPLIVLTALVLLAQALALLAGPWLVRYGIDHGLPDPIAHTPGNAAALNRAVVLYLGAALLGLFLGRVAIILVARVGEGFLRRLRSGLFDHMVGLSLDYFEREKAGRIVARMTSDIDALQELVSQGLVLLVQNVFLFVGAVTLLLILSWQLALGVLIIVPPLVLASRWFRRVSNKGYLEVRDRISANLSTLQESLEGVRVVQAFGQERAFTRRFAETNEEQYEANMYTTRISARYFPIVE